MSDEPGRLSTEGRIIQQVFQTVGKALARWTRLDYEGPDEPVPPPALLVANHGFGGIFDPNVFAVATIADRLGLHGGVPIKILTHDLLWTVGVGQLLEPAGFRPAGREAAMAGLAAGEYVLVMPGGDMEASKSFGHRNQIVFAGRTGYARLAIDAGVPIVPIVVSGAGDTLLVLSDGQNLAKHLHLSSLLRMRTLPVSISLPWGLGIGTAGMILPYLPLPAKMRAAVLDPVVPAPGEDASAVARRVETAMADKLTSMTEGRVPVLGVRWDGWFGGSP